MRPQDNIKRELNLTPFQALFKKEIMRFWKVVGQTVFTPLVNASLYLLIFGVSLGKSITLSSGISYLAFLIPGLVTMATLNNAFQNTSSSILGSKFHGDIIDLKVVPLTLNQIVSAFSLGAIVRGLTVGAITFMVSEVFYFATMGEFLSIAHPFQLLFYLTVGGVTFGLLGVIVGFWARNFEQVNAIGGFVLLPLIYLGGVFYSLENLHPFWQKISQMNPLLYFVNGVRYSILNHSDVPAEKAMMISLISVVVLYFLARRSIQKGSFQKW
ncbi:MAG: ABC transporter permease [Bdellovibrionota bacterium]